MFGKGEQCHGWHMGAGHVRYKLIKSKYLENQIFEVCENHSINFAQDVPKNFIRIFDILITKKTAIQIVWRKLLKLIYNVYFKHICCSRNSHWHTRCNYYKLSNLKIPLSLSNFNNMLKQAEYVLLFL